MEKQKQEALYAGRLKRDRSKQARPISIHDRDREVFRHLFRTRVMSAEQLSALVKTPGTTDESLVRRLHKLFHAGYLDRPRHQSHHVFDPSTGQYRGLRSLLYALGPKGAELVGEEFQDAKVGRLNWLKKNRNLGSGTELGPEYLEHALMVSNVYAALNLAIRKAQGVDLVFWQEGLQVKDVFLVDRDGQHVARPRPDEDLRRFVIFPDAYFSLSLPGKELGTKGARNYFLEADRGTMPTSRFFSKLQAFWKWNRLGLHTKTFGISSFVVLTVTPSIKRRDNLRAIAREADDRKRGSALFRFASIEHLPLESRGSFFGPFWFTPIDDKPTSIFS